MATRDEEQLLQSVALQNAQSILAARQQAERDLLQAKEALSRKADELSREREWFRIVLSSIGDAVITIDSERKVSFLNPGAELLTGWSSNEAVGQSLESVFRIADAQSRELTANRIARVLGEGVPAAPFRHTVLVARNGLHTEIEDSVAPIKDVAGIITGAVMVFRDVAERVRAQQALQQSESSKTAVLDAALDAIITMDYQGKITDFSVSAERIFGYVREAAIGQPVADLLIPMRLRQRHRDGLARYLATGESRVLGKRIEMPVLHANGNEFPAELSIRRIAHVDPPLFTATVRDLTQAKHAHVLQAQLAAIVETSEDAIVGKTLEGIVTSWNKSAERIFGYGAEEIIGRSIKTIIPVERHGEEDFILGQLRRGERIGHFETARVTKDGRLIDVSLSTSPILDAAGKIVGAATIVRDISVRKRAEDALQMETRNLELLNSTGTILSSKFDLQSLVQTVTDAATELSGAQFGAFFYNIIDHKGSNFQLYALSGASREAFEKLGNPSATALFGLTFEGGAPIRCADVLEDPRYGKMGPHHGMPQGNLAVRSYLAVPVKTRSGDVLGALYFGHPETGVFTERAERLVAGIAAQAAVAIDNARLYEGAQKAAEERSVLLESERAARAEAERTSELKDQFLATLSHELRTPLSAVLGWAQVLRRGARSEEDLHKGLDTIERNARVQAQLIEDLLDMSRITSGKVRLDIQPLEPISFIEAAIETVRPAAEAKGVRLHKLLDPAAGPISGDPNRLQQVIWNLLSNAIKFTPKGGKVEVLLERVNSHIEISVADTGQGVKPEFLAYVFDRFRQGDASTTRQYGGLGIGLSIVKSLVEMHGGTVRAQSAGENCGASFTVHLPLTITQRYSIKEGRHYPTAPVALSPEYLAVDLSGIKILVVDDEADARDLIERVLSECNAMVFSAGLAAEALVLIEKEKPDVLVSDIGMPELDGYEFLKRVRALGQVTGRSLPAIALTAFARTEDRTRAMHAGYLAHLSKPVDPAELIATIASVAGRTGAPIAMGRHSTRSEH